MSSKLDKGDRSSANFVMKCKGCPKHLIVDFVPTELEPYTAGDSEQEKPFATFNAKHCTIVSAELGVILCRIFSLFTIYLQSEYLVKMGNQPNFDEVAFEDGEFCDAEPETNSMCAILNPKLIIK